MYHNRSSEYYSWDYDKQKAWDRQQSAIEDAEYESRKTREEAEDDINRAKRQARADIQQARWEAESEYSELNDIYKEEHKLNILLVKLLYTIYTACGEFTIVNGINIGQKIKESYPEIEYTEVD